MKKLRIYLDTSVINFLFADDAPEKRDITREYFAERLVRHDVYISDTVLVEIANMRDPAKRYLLQDTVRRYALRSVDPDPENQARILALAAEYVKRRVVPGSQWEDALHVAVATVTSCSVGISGTWPMLNGKKRLSRGTVIVATKSSCCWSPRWRC